MHFENSLTLRSFSPSGMIFVNQCPIITLFDSGLTHTFMSQKLAKMLDLGVFDLGYSLEVSMPSGRVVTSLSKTDVLPIKYNEAVFYSDFILLDMEDFDIILGMDWLHANHAILDC